MKRLEIGFVVLTIVVVVLKAMTISNGAVIIIAFLLLALLHYIFGFALFNGVEAKNLFKVEYYQKNFSISQTIFAVFLGWGFSVLDLGILFRLKEWPGNEIMMFVGGVGIVVLGALFMQKIKEKKHLLRENFIRIGVGLIYVLVVWQAF
jgi:hypothetical protein